MAQPGDILKQNIDELAALLPLMHDSLPQFEAIASELLDCWKNGGKVLIAGNGGSAADAMHFAEELVVRFCANRKALAAIALCDPTVVTCAGNDFGYDEVFARQVQALGQEGDVLVLMSTSGNSWNLVRAANEAKARKLTTISLLGKDGGKLRDLCDIELIVPCAVTHHIQEAHKLIYHALCQWIDENVA